MFDPLPENFRLKSRQWHFHLLFWNNYKLIGSCERENTHGGPVCSSCSFHQWQHLASLFVLCCSVALTLCDPIDCGPPSSSVHRIFQARIREWVAIPFSRGSSQPKDWTQVSDTTGCLSHQEVAQFIKLIQISPALYALLCMCTVLCNSHTVTCIDLMLMWSPPQSKAELFHHF